MVTANWKGFSMMNEDVDSGAMGSREGGKEERKEGIKGGTERGKTEEREGCYLETMNEPKKYKKEEEDKGKDEAALVGMREKRQVNKLK